MFSVFFTGWHDLMYDNITEHPSTINIIERMNIHQEILLASIYKSFSFIQVSCSIFNEFDTDN